MFDQLLESCFFKGNKMKKLNVIILFSIAVALLGGCNTIQGIGKDVRKAGEVVEDAGKK